MMADERNIKLDDESVVNVSGGSGSELPGPKYEIGARIQLKFSGNDGAVSTVVGIVEDRRATESEWEYLVMYVVNGTPFQHWYPEFAI